MGIYDGGMLWYDLIRAYMEELFFGFGCLVLERRNKNQAQSYKGIYIGGCLWCSIAKIK